VITLSGDMRDELERLLPEAERGGTKVRVLPNFADVTAVETDELGLPKLRDIIYAGSHGPGQNLGLFLEAIAAIPAERRPQVDFFGDGSEKHRLRSRSADLGLDPWVRFHPPVPRDAIERETARARFGLVGAMPDLFRYAFPSKLAAYCSAGIPALVMCDRDSRLAAWLENEGLGHAIGARDAATIAEALTGILAASAAQPEPEAIRAAAGRLFSQAEWLRGIDALLDELGISPAAKKPV
jgi:glycosyltransferase involved in cell wall biosynthesis